MTTNQNVPRDTRERVAWILYQLKLRNLSMRQLAAGSGISPMTLRGAFFQPQYPQEEILAAAIGLTVPELFPERYDAAGVRLHIVRGEKASTSRAPRNVEKHRVA